MTSFGRFVVIAMIAPAALYSQHLSHPVAASRDDALSAPHAPLAEPDTLRILAVMVQFQSDSDPYSSGFGQFDLSTSTDSILDAPPRNASYFRDHLTFAQNYFRRVSGGRQPLAWTLIDSVVTLPAAMAAYSTPESGAPVAVARLARDTWRAVDSLGFVADFSPYNCFIVFHAGVGRDVNLVNILGYDPTPNDIPSLYIGPSAFQSLLGGGIAVNGGAYAITNTIVMPETESRRLPGISGDYLLELGINGLLCASIGNRLGLPDLYNTMTGNSGIGRFGLMDGQAIFSFNGAFPPAPSAWEKAWLGWLSPVTVPGGTTPLTVPAVELADTVYRIPISESEYFLLENRNRSPHGAGVSVTSIFGGTQRVQHFPLDVDGFFAYGIGDLAGNVTDVDDPDWSLPGGTNPDGELFDGGILIWHIDESVIRQHLADDQVNANPGRPGVQLAEADGSQDIGQQYDQFSAASGSEAGTALDFWFKGNSSPVNTNAFTATTHPNTNSVLGAPSHIAFRDFSPRGIRMSVTVQRGDAVAATVRGYPRALGQTVPERALTVVDGPGGSGQAIALATTGNPTGVPTRYSGGTLSLLPPDSTGFVAPFRHDGVMSAALPGSAFAGAVVFDLDHNGTGELVAVDAPQSGNLPAALHLFDLSTASAESLATERLTRTLGSVTPTQLCAGDSLIAVATSAGTVYFIGRQGTSIDSLTLGTTIRGMSLFSGLNRFLLVEADSLVLSARNPDGSQVGAPTVRTFGHRLSGPAATGVFGTGASGANVCLTTDDGFLYLLDESLNPLPGFPVYVSDLPLTPPVLADVDGDGIRDIVCFAGAQIFIYNSAGATLDNFPVDVPGADSLLSPVVGDVNGDGVVDVAGVSANGLLFAFAPTGKSVDGFPLAVTPGTAQSLCIVRGNGAVVLASASSAGVVTLWKTGTIPAQAATLYPWPQSGGDAQRSGRALSVLAGSPLSSEFLPHDRTYNWPNPVTDGLTHIRYYVREDAQVNIKIFDLAGDKVTEFSTQGKGGIDNEVIWNVGGVQSGIYLARVEATSAAGSGVSIIKVAVVK